MSAGKIARIIILLFWGIVVLVMGFFIPSYRGDWGSIFGVIFPFSAYTLCWIGFPIGWRFVRRIIPDSIIIAFFVGAFTMGFSVPIAFFQVLFKKD